MTRKLVSTKQITDIQPIAKADAIETAVIEGGWKVVVKKGEFKVGDIVVYLEIDSWVPTAVAPFLSKGKAPRVYKGIEGERLRTVKLRGQISQGLILPLSVLEEHGTNDLGVIKWEPDVPAHLQGQMKGLFPSFISKTDQERVQNLANELEQAALLGLAFEVTEKLEGSSMTCYLHDNEFGVCSRNVDLKRDESNSFWRRAIIDNIEQVMRERGLHGIAIQGELIGPGIQGNIYNLSDTEFHVFDIYDIHAGEYINPLRRQAVIENLGLKHVPVLNPVYMFPKSADPVQIALELADGKSQLNTASDREGIVFKQITGGLTFKAISNAYLLKQV